MYLPGARGVRVFICIPLQSPSQQPLIWFDLSFSLFPGSKPFITRRQFPAQLPVTGSCSVTVGGGGHRRKREMEQRGRGPHSPLSWVSSCKNSSEAWQLTPETQVKRTASMAVSFRGIQSWLCFPGGSSETDNWLHHRSSGQPSRKEVDPCP